MTKMSRTVRLVKGVATTPMTQALVREGTTVGVLCFLKGEMAKEDRDKKTFACHGRLYRFIRMLFGLMNEPSTF